MLRVSSGIQAELRNQNWTVDFCEGDGYIYILDSRGTVLGCSNSGIVSAMIDAKQQQRKDS